jgi:hypothetical protein
LASRSTAFSSVKRIFGEFPDVPLSVSTLSSTFNHFDAQLSAIDESLGHYSDLVENDTDLASQIATVKAMKKQNSQQINLARQLTI